VSPDATSTGGYVMGGTRLARVTRATVAVFAVAVCLPAALIAGPGFAADSTKVVVQPPKGAAKPVPGSGMGTQAALDGPRCNTGDAYGVYGRWNSATVGGGPACVRPFAAGEKNGGATAQGVTATSVKVVAVIPSAARSTAQSAAAGPKYAGDGTASTWENVLHDYLFANKDFYELWGRSLDVTTYTSTGTDEAAQLADAVAIKAMKPFAVLNLDSFGLDTLVTSLAKAKILVNSYSTSPAEAAAVAPYRWGANPDANAAGANSAEVIGKTLVGKKAEFGGDDVKDQTRKFGLVTIDGDLDIKSFKDSLGKYKGTITSESSYPGSGGALGDPVVSQQQAPVMVQRMKDAGVTTVILFTDAAMNTALMSQADQQGWHPEWFYTGNGYAELPVLASGTPATQASHALGISNFGPYYKAPDNLAALTAMNWFWGKGVGSTSGAVAAAPTWLLQGIHYAGPDLTAKNFAQGLFAAPAVGGNPDNPLVPLSGYGRTTGLPYDAYSPGPADFYPFFVDPDVTATDPGTGTQIKHANFFVANGQRFHVGTWPKTLAWFDKSGAMLERTAYPPKAPPVQAAPACATGLCPSTGAAQPTPGTKDSSYTVSPTPGAVTTQSS